MTRSDRDDGPRADGALPADGTGGFGTAPPGRFLCTTAFSTARQITTPAKKYQARRQPSAPPLLMMGGTTRPTSTRASAAPLLTTADAKPSRCLSNQAPETYRRPSTVPLPSRSATAGEAATQAIRPDGEGSPRR